MHNKRLTIDNCRASRCRIPGMANAQIAFQTRDRFIVEHLIYHAHAFINIEIFRTFAFRCDNAGRFLATMLQRHQAQTDNLCNIQLLRNTLMIVKWIFQCIRVNIFTCDGHSPLANAPNTPHSCVRPVVSPFVLFATAFSLFPTIKNETKPYTHFLPVYRLNTVYLHAPGRVYSTFCVRRSSNNYYKYIDNFRTTKNKR